MGGELDLIAKHLDVFLSGVDFSDEFKLSFFDWFMNLKFTEDSVVLLKTFNICDGVVKNLGSLVGQEFDTSSLVATNSLIFIYSNILNHSKIPKKYAMCAEQLKNYCIDQLNNSLESDLNSRKY